MEIAFRPVARIRTDFAEKFAIPRQSGVLKKTVAVIEMEPSFSDPAFIRGIEDFSHLWLIWHFSEHAPTNAPTVRPPRLGGNRRVGVFATRSPYRPNPVGLSSVRLLGVETKDGKSRLIVSGADLLDGTPIFDIKPYLAYTDSHPDATGGFTDETPFPSLRVDFPEDLLNRVPAAKREALLAVLGEDMRPAYQRDPERVYGFVYAGYNVRFRVENGTALVLGVEKA